MIGPGAIDLSTLCEARRQRKLNDVRTAEEISSSEHPILRAYARLCLQALEAEAAPETVPDLWKRRGLISIAGMSRVCQRLQIPGEWRWRGYSLALPIRRGDQHD